eukprot:TRINITY_DN1985_c0_g1_i1.p1 TRINITY_DN1985_c0_g1~~TRINITY_DN1985_c0_g1_i1.p1  ORF type:complete len:311 (-),score=81.55 TRINITY_DN1985_c0_g1_i1:180-1112(-)
MSESLESERLHRLSMEFAKVCKHPFCSCEEMKRLCEEDSDFKARKFLNEGDNTLQNSLHVLTMANPPLELVKVLVEGDIDFSFRSMPSLSKSGQNHWTPFQNFILSHSRQREDVVEVLRILEYPNALLDVDKYGNNALMLFVANDDDDETREDVVRYLLSLDKDRQARSYSLTPDDQTAFSFLCLLNPFPNLIKLFLRDDGDRKIRNATEGYGYYVGTLTETMSAMFLGNSKRWHLADGKGRHLLIELYYPLLVANTFLLGGPVCDEDDHEMTDSKIYNHEEFAMNTLKWMYDGFDEVIDAWIKVPDVLM